MQLTCPCCHAHVPLEAALQDEAGRELVAMLAAMQPQLALPLVHYLGFFRPLRQQLGWGRSLRLAHEVVALCPAPVDTLVHGLLEASRGLDDKRAQPGWKPLGNHNYLKRVLESVQARMNAPTNGATDGPAAAVVATAAPAGTGSATRAPRSQAGGALVALEGMRR